MVIGLEGIKMKEEKVKLVLDWPVFKSVKNIHDTIKCKQTLIRYR